MLLENGLSGVKVIHKISALNRLLRPRIFLGHDQSRGGSVSRSFVEFHGVVVVAER